MKPQSIVHQIQGSLTSRNGAGFCLPVALLLATSGLVLYRHVTQAASPRHNRGDPMKTFLAMIVAQMLPLALLEAKVAFGADPVALISRASPKVLLMHASFLAFRVLCHPFTEIGEGSWNLLGLLMSLAILIKAFNLRPSVSSLYEYRDVFCLMVLACGAACATEVLDIILRAVSSSSDMPIMSLDAKTLQLMAKDTSDYIEILAFVPALWGTQRSKDISPESTVAMSTQNRTALVFAFLVGFYITEDVFSAVTLPRKYRLAMMAHILHFLLLLDLCGFFLAHVFNPTKLKGELMKWADTCLSV